MKKHLILFNMSYRTDWEAGMVNRNYFIQNELRASGAFESILAIDFLPFSLKKIAKVLVEQRPYIKTPHTIYRTLTTRVDRDPLHENLFWMSATDLSHFDAALLQCGMNPAEALFWSYTPFTSNMMERYPDSTHVFDAVDNWMTHPSYGAYTQQLTQHYARIQKKADLIFSVSEALQDIVGDRVIVIPNGVDARHFANAEKMQKKSSNQKVIGYHGVIQSRFDSDLVKEVVQQRPEYHFSIVGPIWREMEPVMHQLEDSYENVELVGQIPYAELPAQIARWDVAFIPHITNGFTASMNPMKLYEYLAAGKPVVSTPIAGIERFSEFVDVGVTAQECAQALDRAIAQDTPELHSQRRDAVKNETWRQRVTTMLSNISAVDL